MLNYLILCKFSKNIVTICRVQDIYSIEGIVQVGEEVVEVFTCILKTT